MNSISTTTSYDSTPHRQLYGLPPFVPPAAPTSYHFTPLRGEQELLTLYNRMAANLERDNRAARRALGLPAPARLLCYFCGKYAGQYGNNCAPLVVPPTARACDSCNITIVCAARQWHMRND